MYLQNKYYKWYQNIIENAKQRSCPKCYTENHHIIPKSLGGNNITSNLVELTAKEHFICHLLLSKFTYGTDKEKMDYALWMMISASNNYHRRYQINSRLYETIKNNLQPVFSKQHKGKPKSKEHCEKISTTRKQMFADGSLQIKVYESTREKLSLNRLGSNLSEETKQKIGKIHKGKSLSDVQKKNLSILNLNKTHSDESKSKISNTQKQQYANGDRVAVKGMLGKKLSEEAKQKMRKPKKRATCPHCGKHGGINGLKRFHFENCKFKGIVNESNSQS